MENGITAGTFTVTLKTYNYCPSCGRKLEAGWQFCPQCGHSAQEYASPFIVPFPVYPAYPWIPANPWYPCGDGTPTITC